MTATRPHVEQNDRLQPRRLWFGLLGAPVIWFAYLGVAWAVVEFGCRLGLRNYLIFGFDSLDVLVVIATGVALVVAVASVVVAISSWRQVQADERAETRGERIWQVRWFMSAIGSILGGLFILAIVLTFVPVFFLHTCRGPIG